jgi:hypothetical protein
MDKPAKRDKQTFASLFDEVFRWLAANNKLGTHGRHETALATVCKTSVKNIRRWRDGSNAPKRDSWETAKNGLSQTGISEEGLRSLDSAWTYANASKLSPSSSETSRVRLGGRPYSIVPRNPFPKLCVVGLDIPEQGCSTEDFIVTGEIRFARAPDVVDDEPMTVGIRRAVLLPVASNCYVKPGSLYRPASDGQLAGNGAGQTIFEAGTKDLWSVLEGDQLKGGTLARFLASGEPDASPPAVDVLVQLEGPRDLCVTLTGELKNRSPAQRKLAERWIAEQLGRTVQETDGSLRVASCSLRWTRRS